MNNTTINILKNISNNKSDDFLSYIQNTQEDYRLSKKEIHSNKLLKEIAFSKDNLEQLATLNWFIKDRTQRKSLWDKTFHKDFTEEQIEYMTESLYSQFKYLEKKIGISFNEYLQREGDNLEKIFIPKNFKEKGGGRYLDGRRAIMISNDEVNFGEECDYRMFYNLFSHENNHAFSYSKDSFGFMKENSFFSKKDFKGLDINDFAAENLALQMTKVYSPDFVERNIEREDTHFVKGKIPIGTISYESRGYSYTNIIDASSLVYKCYESEILDCFINSKRIEDVFEGDTLQAFKAMGETIGKTYPYNMYEIHKESGKDQLKFESICATLVSYYINEQLEKKDLLDPINDKSKIDEIDNNLNEILETIVSDKRTLKTETSNYNIEQIYLKKIEYNCPKLKISPTTRSFGRDSIKEIKIPKTSSPKQIKEANLVEQQVEEILQEENIFEL